MANPSAASESHARQTAIQPSGSDGKVSDGFAFGAGLSRVPGPNISVMYSAQFWT
jgi:hypothetical protein